MTPKERDRFARETRADPLVFGGMLSKIRTQHAQCSRKEDMVHFLLLLLVLLLLLTP
jgi:hypothetical protein